MHFMRCAGARQKCVMPVQNRGAIPRLCFKHSPGLCKLIEISLANASRQHPGGNARGFSTSSSLLMTKSHGENSLMQHGEGNMVGVLRLRAIEFHWSKKCRGAPLDLMTVLK